MLLRFVTLAALIVGVTASGQACAQPRQPSGAQPTRDEGIAKKSENPLTGLISGPLPVTYVEDLTSGLDVLSQGVNTGSNQTLLQLFVNYNLENGWAPVSAPIITANWEADSDWLVPIGGGMSKLLKTGSLPATAMAQAYYNPEHPDFARDWQLRIGISFLFQKRHRYLGELGVPRLRQ